MEVYDHADLYDRLYSWDVRAECGFVLRASRRWGVPAPRRVLEPFCGTGRLLAAMPGFRVGFDLSAPMLARAAARGLPVVRADASVCPFAPASFDLAFCLIDSFRHLATRAAARAHLGGVARALRPGAVYVLGLEVTGHLPAAPSVDEWSVEQDGRRITGTVRACGDLDATTRLETVRATVDVRRRGEIEHRAESLWPMRVWSPRELEELIDEEGSFEPVAAFPGDYSRTEPVELGELAGSSLLVLRREGRS